MDIEKLYIGIGGIPVIMRSALPTLTILAGIAFLIISGIPLVSAQEYSMTEEEDNDTEEEANLLEEGRTKGSVGKEEEDPGDYFMISPEMVVDAYITVENLEGNSTIRMRIYPGGIPDPKDHFDKEVSAGDQASTEIYSMEYDDTYLIEITGEGEYILDLYLEPYIRDHPPKDYYIEEESDEISFFSGPLMFGTCCLAGFVILILVGIGLAIIIAIRKLGED